MNFIYAYCNQDGLATQTSLGPLPGTPFYIGMGTGERHLAHLREAMRKSGPKTNVLKFDAIRKLLDIGRIPIIVKLQDGLTREEAKTLEIKLIAELGTIKWVEGVSKRGPLTNKHKGGGGSRTGPLPPGTGAKISATRKSRNIKLSEEHKVALHSGGKNRVRTAEENTKRGAAISAANTPEVVAKREATRRKKHGGWYSHEALERYAELVASGALKHTEETKRQIAENTRAAMAKDEVREKMRKSAAKRWSDPAEAEKIRERNSKTYELVNRQTGERFIVKNMAAWCRQNGTYQRKVWKEYVVTSL